MTVITKTQIKNNSQHITFADGSSGNTATNNKDNVQSQKGLLKWTSNEAVHSLPQKGLRSISPAPCALTPCSRQTIQRGRSAPVSRLSLAPVPHGTPTRWARP